MSWTVLEEKKEGDYGQQFMMQSTDGPFNPVGGASSRLLDDSLVNQIESAGDSVVCGPDIRHLGEYEDGSKLSSHLMGLCENLLEQLRSMNRFDNPALLVYASHLCT